MELHNCTKDILELLLDNCEPEYMRILQCTCKSDLYTKIEEQGILISV